ncbi:PREDICTED: transmembrane protein 163 [Leptosomus discolor]|uniref:transmembrane protein 163 n=1 Tax=Leptosomus discolor TaxID=188344 RepID=UPI00052275E2|nr:PREDICTED: transmembrane protein 163 [Leptosomus discolor]
MAVAGQRVPSCLSKKIPMFWNMRALGGPPVAPVSELLTVITGDLDVGDHLLHYGDSKPGACVILGVIFLLSSICIVIKAIHDLAKKVLPEVDDFLYSVSVLSGILCTVLAVIKFMLGKVLTSRALITDGFNSLVGGIMGFSILLSAEVFKHNSSVWYLDGSIGVLIGLTIFAYGIKLLIDMIPRVRQTRHYEMFE